MLLSNRLLFGIIHDKKYLRVNIFNLSKIRSLLGQMKAAAKVRQPQKRHQEMIYREAQEGELGKQKLLFCSG